MTTTTHRAEIIGADQWGDILGPTWCGITAGTYATDQTERVTCTTCAGMHRAFGIAAPAPIITEQTQEMTR